MCVPVRNRGKLSGFTLVEMAIVLVIIGIILAGVMKGRDIVRGSQVKQFSQMFAQKWVTVAQTYYDKTGRVLNDGGINGGVAAGVPNGVMDGNTASTAAIATNMFTVLNGVGINLCSMVKSKLVGAVAGVNVVAASTVCQDNANVAIMNPWQTTVDGEFISGSRVEVDFVGVTLTVNNIAQNRNTVVLYNVPCDVARGLDTAIDGTENGVSGSCLGFDASYNASPTGANVAPAGGYAAGGAAIATAWGAAGAGGATPQAQNVGIVLDF